MNDRIQDGRHARRARTEARLLQAVGDILREEGVAGLGVSSVAARAGVDKVLIYRYFDSIEGLMAAYAARSDFWPTLDELLGPGRALLRHPDRAEGGARILMNYARALRTRPVTLDLLAWECAHRNALTQAVENVREQRFHELMTVLEKAGYPIESGGAELSALFGAAIGYLVVRARHIHSYGGLSIGTDADWEHMGRLFEIAFRALLDRKPTANATTSRGRRANRR